MRFEWGQEDACGVPKISKRKKILEGKLTVAELACDLRRG